MAFSEALARRIRDGLARRKYIEEKKMFGGVGFLLNGNLLGGAIARLASGAFGAARQGVRHHGPSDEGLGAGSPGRRRG
jgi:hypothetical protein